MTLTVEEPLGDVSGFAKHDFRTSVTEISGEIDASFRKSFSNSRGRGWGGDLGSGSCSWFEITLNVLQLIYKYLVVSCAVFNYLVVGLKAPCSSLCCFQLPSSWFKSTL